MRQQGRLSGVAIATRGVLNVFGRSRAKEHLSKLLGTSIQDAIMGACATPFDREPWIDGGYAYCRYGAGNQRPALAEPIEDRIFFAGEACSLDHTSMAHGAWLSGGKAIEQIANLKS